MGRPPSETDGSTDRPQTRGDRGYRLTGAADADDEHAAKRQEADRLASCRYEGMDAVQCCAGDKALKRRVSSTAKEGAACAHQQTQAEQPASLNSPGMVQWRMINNDEFNLI